MLRKLSTPERELYAYFGLRQLPRELGFEVYDRTPSQTFGEQTSVCDIRYQYLNLLKKDNVDFNMLTGVIGRGYTAADSKISNFLRKKTKQRNHFNHE
ncbi:hypothetical protein T265_01924 [Opisthorchis viverrini]|uniref:Uncharacterized protein n=1 Tax=Opisthorchis viverrini TaxID=6198 RepID=A0A074ZY32_OPIVI|nr:hypothetical protein T265_01924 [Opisthorchis viverrini]KER31996.1 hypothetical protein T265_01924 [Opisthorchis viverrini]